MNKEEQLKRDHYAIYDTRRDQYLGMGMKESGGLVFAWMEDESPILEKCTHVSVAPFSAPDRNLKKLAKTIVEAFEQENFPDGENLKDCVLVVTLLDQGLNVKEVCHDTVIGGLFDDA